MKPVTILAFFGFIIAVAAGFFLVNQNPHERAAEAPPPEAEPPGGPILEGANFSALPVVSLYLKKFSPEEERWAFILEGLDEGDHASFRLFAPEDQLLIREHWDTAQNAPATVLGELEKSTMGSSPRSVSTGETNLDAYVEKAGIYVARLVSGQRKLKLQVHAPGVGAYGVSFQNGTFQPWKKDLTQAWFYIPPNAVSLRFAGRGVRLFDGKDKQLYPDADGSKNEVELAVTERETFWRVEFVAPDWEFRAGGFPVILGEDKEFLRELQAGLIRTASGAWVPHHFQARAEDAIRELLDPAKVGDTQELLRLMEAEPAEWTDEDLQTMNQLRGAFGLYPHLKFALEEQLLDPENHWGGTIGREVWQERLSANTPETRWDYLRRNPLRAGQGHGGLSSHAYAVSLAQAYALDRPFNGLRGRSELLNRAAVAALRDLMSVNEEGILAGSGAEMSDYSGFPSFVFGFRHFQEFAIAAPHMPPHIREIWTEGLRHLVDRYWPEGLLSTRNQSSHYLAAFQYFAMGSEDPTDKELAGEFARRFVAGMSDAGYPQEASGPCASYAGISHHYMGKYWKLSGDENMKSALEKSYDFFNHTAAPEPDGKALAGFNFNHRVPAGFHAEQYEGARSLAWMGLENPKPWSRNEPSPEDEEDSSTTTWSPQPIAAPARFPQIGYHAAITRGGDASPGRWPAEAEEPFIRTFGNELIAVKRPGYFASFYVGKPASSPHYLFGTAQGIKPWPDGGESAGASMADLYQVKQTRRPFNNGGITIFQTPEFGSAILGAPVPYTHHGLVAHGEEGLLHAEDYFAAEFSLDEEAGRLVCSGKLDSLPLQYRRTYDFDDDVLKVRLRLFAAEGFSVESLVECIPLVGGKAKARGAQIQLWESGRLLQGLAGSGDEVRLIDSRGNGIRIHFSENVELSACNTGPVSAGGLQHNRVEIPLPSTWKKGQLFTLSYEIHPIHSGAGTTAAIP